MEGPVLILAAHPDDEVLGCGGTIARLADQGAEVTIAILGEGITSRLATREKARASELKALEQTSKDAARFLGAADVRFFGLPDNRFDSVPLLDIVKIVEGLVEEVRPVTVFTQHGGDLNVDHQLTFRAAMTAMRPRAASRVKNLYAFEVASSTEWAFGKFAPVFSPDVFVDVSRTLGRKLEAMAIYEGEARIFPHPRSARALTAQAEKWGATSGLPAAEAFETVLRRY